MMNIIAWLVTPVSGAIIGYFTNWLAIKMLFRPHTEKRLFGVRLPFTPGLIPKERYALSKKVGETLKKNVFTDDVLIEAISSPEVTEKLVELADELFVKLRGSEVTVGDILEKTKVMENEAVVSGAKRLVAAKMPELAEYIKTLPEKNSELEESLRGLVANIAEEQFGKFVGLFVKYDKVYDNIKKNVFEYISEPENQALLSEKACEFMDGFLGRAESENFTQIKVGELFSKIPESAVVWIRDMLIKGLTLSVGKGGSYVISSLNIAQIAEDKINAFGVSEAEDIIISVVNRELNMITVLGGVLGFIIGLLPAVINSLTV